jgi:eukaryotic-like serine/threonine-protein kinase
MDTPPASAPKGFFGEDIELPGIESNVDDLPAGFRLGSYVLQECVGRGAMATVYRAQHSLLKSIVAVKLMKRTLLTSAEARHRFFREARAAAAIKHPHVVRITDAGTVNSLPYLVMEFLEGSDLEKLIQDSGGLAEPELVALALPLVAALAVVHDAGIVHRDLKPANVFLAREAGDALVPKLLDFGVSKLDEDVITDDMVATRFDQIMGSPLYVPPEGINGVGGLSARSDQYSFGVILYECATGKPPFVQESLLKLLNSIADGKFEPPSFIRPAISAGFEQVILKAMSATPEQRFDDMRALGRALLDLADDATVARWAPTFAYERSTNRAPAPSLLPSAPAPALALMAAPRAFTLTTPANTTDVFAVVEPPLETALVPRARTSRRRRARASFLGLLGIALLIYCALRIAASRSGTHEPASEGIERHALLPPAPPAELEHASTEATITNAAPGEPFSAGLSPTNASARPEAEPAHAESEADDAPALPAPASAKPESPRRSHPASDSKQQMEQLFFPITRKKSASTPPPSGNERIRVANEAPILD